MCFSMASLFLNVYWFLHILKPTLLPHAKTQSPDVNAYLPVDYTTSPMSLCTSLAVYNQVKKLTKGECTSVLGQKRSAAHRQTGALQTVFWLLGEYMGDLRFVIRTRNFQNTRRRFLNVKYQKTRNDSLHF